MLSREGIWLIVQRDDGEKMRKEKKGRIINERLLFLFSFSYIGRKYSQRDGKLEWKSSDRAQWEETPIETWPYKLPTVDSECSEHRITFWGSRLL